MAIKRRKVAHCIYTLIINREVKEEKRQTNISVRLSLFYDSFLRLGLILWHRKGDVEMEYCGNQECQ